VKLVVGRELASSDLVRVTGTIHSAEGERTVWFELPRDCEADVTTSGDPWLALMLPYAVQTGEPIELSLAVDPLLLENARQLVGTWVGWYPDLANCEIHAPTQRAAVSGGRGAQFFSGGVDSWFTLLRHTETTSRFPKIGEVDDLITVAGLDIPIGNVDEFAQLAGSTREVAEKFGKRHVVIRTNLREHMEGAWKAAWGPRWGSLSHAAALAAMGLLLQRRYARVLIGSTGLGVLRPWGSHPMTDVLFSTSTTSFLHDHPLYSRAQKTERVAESVYAVSRLKVCFTGGTFRNCSVCSKCHRTLLSLDIVGALDRASSFDVEAYQRNRNRAILVSSEIDRLLAEDVRALALRRGRLDIAAVIDRSIERSRHVRTLSEMAKRFGWRASQAVYRSLARDMIGA
jgi:hypothetical protein